MRCRISPAALLVKVMARMLPGRTPCCKRWATRRVMTRVLPLPAPARISSGPSMCRAASQRAARWAAKEAILKALGIRWQPSLSWTDMEVRSQRDGRAEVRLAGAVRELAETQQVGKILLSTSHCRAYAVAYATALRS